MNCNELRERSEYITWVERTYYTKYITFVSLESFRDILDQSDDDIWGDYDE